MDPQVAAKLQNNQIKSCPHDGLPQFDDLSALKPPLDPVERLLLGQIVQLENLWSLDTLRELHMETVSALSAESGIPYDPAMGQMYMRSFHPALESLEDKGVIERVPNQDPTVGSDKIRWQRKP